MGIAVDTGILRDLRYIFTEHRRTMKVTSSGAGCLDDAVDARDLLDTQPNYWRDFLWLEIVVFGIEAQVHAVVGEREIELLLGLV
jgi:hypothetical protein